MAEKTLTLTLILIILLLLFQLTQYEPNSRSQEAIISKESMIDTFYHVKAKAAKFDLTVKKVKVTPGSSFVQTMMGRSSKCYIPSFMEIGPLVPVKKIFEGFLPNMGMAAILVM